jgi:hypothetical protein
LGPFLRDGFLAGLPAVVKALAQRAVPVARARALVELHAPRRAGGLAARAGVDGAGLFARAAAREGILTGKLPAAAVAVTAGLDALVALDLGVFEQLALGRGAGAERGHEGQHQEDGGA